jgi:NADH-quinone oxidoreductase subunit J
MMTAEVAIFFVFAALALAGAVGVITLRNPMYSAISLLCSFLSVAVLFLTVSA